MSTIPTMQEIINLYLYGTKDAPSDLLNEDIVNRPSDATTTYDINMNDFMHISAGAYIKPGNFNAFTNFLEGKYDSKLSPGIYTTEDFFTAIGVANTVEARSLGIRNYSLDIESSDYLDRSYVFGSMSFRINKDAQFIVDENGHKHIKNIAIEANPDNFNYESSSIIATVVVK